LTKIYFRYKFTK